MEDFKFGWLLTHVLQLYAVVGCKTIVIVFRYYVEESYRPQAAWREVERERMAHFSEWETCPYEHTSCVQTSTVLVNNAAFFVDFFDLHVCLVANFGAWLPGSCASN